MFIILWLVAFSFSRPFFHINGLNKGEGDQAALARLLHNDDDDDDSI